MGSARSNIFAPGPPAAAAGPKVHVETPSPAGLTAPRPNTDQVPVTLEKALEIRVKRGISSATIPSQNSLNKKMQKLVIEGGQPLSGTIVPAGNKNAALPCIAAALLTDEDVCSRTCRASATSTRCSRCSRTSASPSSGATTTSWCSNASGVDHQDLDEAARQRDSRLLPARRSAAGALRPRRDAAARRRRDRPPPARSAPRRLSRARRDRRRQRPLDHDRRPQTGSARPTS